VYQLRIEAGPMLDLLWKNRVVPRSVVRCLEVCRERLRAAREQATAATLRTLAGIEQLIHAIRLTDWDKLLGEAEAVSTSRSSALVDHGSALLNATLNIHHLIADGFLNHQIHMGPDIQPSLFGFKHAL
jgi:uncharacterized alpha-E superfamily protein